MQTRNPNPPNVGDPIRADFLAQLAEACGLASGAGAAAPLSLQSTAAGPTMRYGGPIFGAYVGITTSTITARSGTTLGSGTVKIQSVNGTTTSDLGGGTPISVTAYNISASTNTIASGKYVILMRIGGRYFIITAEC